MNGAMFEIVGDITNVQVIATGRGIRRLKTCESGTAAGVGGNSRVATAEYRHTPDAPKPITKVLFGGHSVAGFKITSGVAQGRGYHMLRFGR